VDGDTAVLNQNFISEKHLHSAINGMAGFVKSIIDKMYVYKNIEMIIFSQEYVDVIKK
jgi:hypothetical protein